MSRQPAPAETVTTMHASIMRFAGDPDALVAAYDAMRAQIPDSSVVFHACLRTDDGILVIDTCPSKEAFETFRDGDRFRDLLQRHGLPWPEITDHPIRRGRAGRAVTTTAPIPVGVLDEIEYAAADDLWAAVVPADRRDAGLIRVRRGGCLVLGSRLTPASAMLNRILGAGTADIADESLSAAIDVLRGAGCTCQVSVREGTHEGRALRRHLEGQGFVEGYAWMKFVHDPAAPECGAPPARVRVRPCTAGDGRRLGAILVAGFDLPPVLAVIGEAIVGRAGWHCYVAENDAGEAVGIGAMYVDGEVAWLGLGATRPEARGLGAQGALLRRRVADAHALGCSLVVTETGERVEGRPSGSYRNILRAGFVEYGLRRHMVLPPPR